MNPWDQLIEGVELPFHPDLVIPPMFTVELPIPEPTPVGDVEQAAHQSVVAVLAGDVTQGMTVAVGAGSRGLTDRVALMRGTINGLRSLGAEPFVVPAMGSHGGATANGQRAMLESLGMTEEALGAEIRASMETVVVAHTADGMPLYLDEHAAAADRILPVNRIKPHTCFKGPDRERLHEDGSRRVRQAARCGADPFLWTAGDAQSTVARHRILARHRAPARRRCIDRVAHGRRRQGAGIEQQRCRR
jgi:hypothetical protein